MLGGVGPRNPSWLLNVAILLFVSTEHPEPGRGDPHVSQQVGDKFSM